MSKFKVGDRVRILHSDYPGLGLKVGDIHEIIMVIDDIVFLKSTRGDNLPFYPHEVEFVPQNAIQPNHQYTSKNGQKWECIAVRGDTAWLAGVFDGVADGAAYMYKLDGSAVCLASGGEAYDIKWEPVVEWRKNKAHLGEDGGSYHMEAGESRKYSRGVTVTIKYPVVDGEPDFTKATVTPV